jgi:hypothetical protein
MASALMERFNPAQTIGTHLTEESQFVQKDEPAKRDQEAKSERKVVGMDGKRYPEKRRASQTKIRRIELIKEMAAEGFRSKQIAPKAGVAPEHVRVLDRECGMGLISLRTFWCLGSTH